VTTGADPVKVKAPRARVRPGGAPLCCLPTGHRGRPCSRGRPDHDAPADLGGHRRHGRQPRSAAQPRCRIGRRAGGVTGWGASRGRPPRGRTASQGLTIGGAPLCCLQAHQPAAAALGGQRRLRALAQLLAGRALRRLWRAAPRHIPWPRRRASLLALLGAAVPPLGVRGQERPIAKRARDGKPDIRDRCFEPPVATCSRCELLRRRQSQPGLAGSHSRAPPVKNVGELQEKRMQASMWRALGNGAVTATGLGRPSRGT